MWFDGVRWVLLGLVSLAVSAPALGADGGIAVTPPGVFPRVTLEPSSGAVSVCPDTPLRLTFSAPVKLGTGRIRILDAQDNEVESIDVAAPIKVRSIGGLDNYRHYAVAVRGSEVEIRLAAPLAYGRAYRVAVDSDAIRDAQGAAGGGAGDWRFSTRAVPPARAANLTVAADGTGDFCTLQGALDFIPAGNRDRTTILLKPGVYREMIHFTQKHAITILGQDRRNTIIEYATNANFNNAPGTYRRGVLLAHRVEDLVVGNLTIHNTTPQGGSQAEAIILNGTTSARAIITGVDLRSFQDTLQINGQAYVSDSYIEGDVDFMWGSGPCFFEDCDIQALRRNAYYTQIRNPPTNHGYVYNRCTFRGAPGVTGNVLSRIDPARFPASEVVLLDCVLTDAVSPVAWRFDRFAAGAATPGIHFWEYNSRDPEGRPVDVTGRLAASRQLHKEADADLIAQYGNPVWVLGGQWKPQLAPLVAAQPTDKTVRAGQSVMLAVQAVGVPAVTYQWHRSGVAIAGATEPALRVFSGDAGTYSVRVHNAAGEAYSRQVEVKVE